MAQIKRAFVRALWGGDLIPRSQTKIVADIQECLSREFQVPFVTYCFGRNNRDLLRKMGLKPRMVHRSDVVNFSNTKRHRHVPKKHIYYGVNMWRHKLVAIKCALEEYDEIVWLDWDCRLLQELPSWFWDRISVGSHIQASLVQYRNPRCWWRTIDNRKTIGGAFIYVRSIATIQSILAFHGIHRHQDDEAVVSRYIDHVRNGWHGTESYIRGGFEPFCYKIRNQIRPPIVPLFTAK